jgi:hypothetical protein
VILQLITDDGVKTRGHRKNCFNENYKLVGISEGPHKQYGTLCVFDFAEEFTPKDGGAGSKTKKPLKKSDVQKNPAPAQKNPAPAQKNPLAQQM